MTSRAAQFQIFLEIRKATSPPDTDGTAKHSGNAVITKIHIKNELAGSGATGSSLLGYAGGSDSGG